MLVYQAGKYAEAAELYKKALSGEVGNELNDYWLASAYFQSGRRLEAISTWQKMGARRMASFFNQKAKEQFKMNEYLAAIDLALLAVQIDPTYGLGYYQLGRAYQDNGNLAEAVSAFEFSLLEDLTAEEKGQVYYQLGLVYQNQGNKPATFSALNQALDLLPDSDLVRRDLADE
ncbi:MAG: tetratricopeptide repeat protein, partial [Anaerolineaceae bacterium]|nr:tetratricopeptide repeat protein [Anaerolineaceae bacterium]